MDISGLLFCGLISFFKGENMYFGNFTQKTNKRKC